MPAPSQFTTLMVHKARADQIRFEAEKRGISAAEMVEALINLGIEHGHLPDHLPGFAIYPDPVDGVTALLGEVQLPSLSPASARVFADALVVNVNKEGRHRSQPAKLHDGSVLMIGRAGRGLVITRLPSPGAEVQKVTMTTSMARDLARQLKHAALEFENFDAR